MGLELDKIIESKILIKYKLHYRARRVEKRTGYRGDTDDYDHDDDYTMMTITTMMNLKMMIMKTMTMIKHGRILSPPYFILGILHHKQAFFLNFLMVESYSHLGFHV